MSESDLSVLAGVPPGWLTVLAVVVALGTVYLVAGLGALLGRIAPVLLGPSTAERVAALEATAAGLAERNRLARELHDSVGHALTVTTLQAAAARTVLDRDPDFARRALAAIEDAGRAAMADLDHVIGLLRAADDADTPSTAPQLTLAQLERLLTDVRAAGLSLTAEVTGPVTQVPAGVSREGYRVVQEALTNALRHGAARRAQVALHAGPDALHIEVRNPTRQDLPAGATGRTAGSGRGLAGMRERVRLLHGTMQAGPTSAGRTGDTGPEPGTGPEEWVVRTTLPYPAGGQTVR